MSLDLWLAILAVTMFATGVWLILWWVRDRVRYDSSSRDE